MASVTLTLSSKTDRYRQDESPALGFQDKTAEFLRHIRVSPVRKRNYGIVFQIVCRYELFSGLPLRLDAMTHEDLAAIRDYYCEQNYVSRR